MSLNERLKATLEKRISQNSYRVLGKVAKELIDFSSNDYLGLAQNERLQHRVKHAYEAMVSQRLGSTGSRLLSGNSEIYEELEQQLAVSHNGDAALVFNSGYNANTAFFSSIPNKHDLIIYDDLIHACIKEGARLSLAKHQSFRHNDLIDLAKKIDRSGVQNIFVAVESLYSMDGDFAPLEALADLCTEKKVYLIVDEAHTTGVFGKSGAGLVTQLGLDHQVFIKIHTFGKGIGAHGAAVISSQLVKDYLINFSRQFIYTTSLPPHAIVVLREAYRFLEEFNFMHIDLFERIKLFHATCLYVSSPYNSPIQSVIIPGNDQVKRCAERLQNDGFNVKAVLSPTVKKGTERLRICIHQFNTLEDIERLANAINVMMK